MATARRPQDHGRTLDVDAVVDAAVHVLRAEGPGGLSLVRVAAQLGVTQPALYRHVQGIDGLQRKVAERARAGLLAAVTAAAVGRSGEDALVAMARAWRDYVRGDPALYAMTDRSPLAGDAGNEALVAEVVAVLRRVVESFGVTGRAAGDAAWVVRSTLHGFASLEVQSGNPRSHDAERAFKAMTNLLASGLRSTAAR